MAASNPGIQLQIARFSKGTPNPQVIVVSHERSGTHFLMNSIGLCFGYVASPWINFDHPTLPINFYAPQAVRAFFGDLAGRHLASLIKSHHPIPFFDPHLTYITDNFRILYIHRDPLQTLRSFWKLVERCTWIEGPQGLSCAEFLRAQPMGFLMRYQMHQEPTMVHRWMHHVESWLDAADRHPNIHVVSYAALKDDYAATIERIGAFLGVSPRKIEMPPRDQNVILSTQGIDYEQECRLGEEDRMFVRDVAGPLMDRLGYI